MADQFSRLSADLENVSMLLAKIEASDSLNELKELEEQASSRRWLHHAASVVKEERPFEGHRIRELLGPNGYAVLYGENATSNDYLTLRVAKGSDYWLHVRGGVSAHVVVRTLNQPDRVPREVLIYAAKIPAQNSPGKHSQMVAVDYTLRKYVRKSRGAPAGSVLYTHEKTLHV